MQSILNTVFPEAAATPAAELSAITASTITFASGGHPVRLSAFVPAGAIRLPAVLVLHGATGLDAGNRYVRQIAETWAAQGFATYLLHYFDRTGTIYASESTMQREYPHWLSAMHDAVSCIASQPAVDPHRIGLVGYSLGGYLSVAHAARDPRIGAVVEIAGGIDAVTAASSAPLPPTLIIHGEADRRVPFTEAQKLRDHLQRRQSPFATCFYPGEGHFLSIPTAFAALEVGVEFLQQHLAQKAR